MELQGRTFKKMVSGYASANLCNQEGHREHQTSVHRSIEAIRQLMVLSDIDSHSLTIEVRQQHKTAQNSTSTITTAQKHR